MSKIYMDISELIDKYEKSLSRNNNSAKYVLALSILMLKPQNNIIRFEEIADKAIDIYFRNIYKYKLVEHNKNQPTKVQKDMSAYFDKYGYLDELTSTHKNNIVDIVVKNKNNGFFKYVLPCFTGAKKNEKGQYVYPVVGENEFFFYNLNTEEVILSDEFLKLIKQEYHILRFITIEKYAQYLKKRNSQNIEIYEILNYY